MAKAFDSLDHNYMFSVLKFFGFGEQIIKWLSLIGHKRRTSIIMDNGINSSFFDLETGSAQGDNPSPNLFNFCEQILIFKIELDNRIIHIKRPEPIRIFQDGGVYSAENNRDTDVYKSLADDNTILSVINRQSLLSVKEILTNFSIISGLHCNFDKTTLLPIFPVSEIEKEWIQEAGFTISPTIKLLGADITADFRDIVNNFSKFAKK
jgi:hypothetical protein